MSWKHKCSTGFSPQSLSWRQELSCPPYGSITSQRRGTYLILLLSSPQSLVSARCKKMRSLPSKLRQIEKAFVHPITHVSNDHVIINLERLDLFVWSRVDHGRRDTLVTEPSFTEHLYEKRYLHRQSHI